MRVLLLLSISLLASASGAQTVEDTTSTWRYTPLGVGDAWEYKVYLQYGVTGLIYRYSMVREIEADTTVDGRGYVVIQERTRDVRGSWTYMLPEDRRFIARYDSASAQLVTREIGSAEEQVLPCPLNSPFQVPPEASAELMCANGEVRAVSGGYAQEVFVRGTGPYVLTVKTLTDPSPLQIEGVYEGEAYAAGVGLLERKAVVEGYLVSTRLTVARVGGEWYGDPLNAHFSGVPGLPEPSSFFPLSVGNEWHYTRGNGGPLVETRRVDRDTMIVGVPYSVLRIEQFQTDGTSKIREVSLRYNPETTEIDLADPSEYRGLGIPACPLGARNENTSCGGCSAYVYVRPERILVGADEIETVAMYYDTQGCETQAEFGVGIGSTFFGSWGYNARLAYASVNGRVYGQQVVNTVSEPSVPVFGITASPNPTAGPLAVTLRQRRPGEVLLEAFDALGRRVLSREVAPEARVEIDASAWAPGLYTLRVTSGDEVATTRVVRR